MYPVHVCPKAALEAGRSVGLQSDELAPSMRDEAGKAPEEALRRPPASALHSLAPCCTALS